MFKKIAPDQSWRLLEPASQICVVFGVRFERRIGKVDKKNANPQEN